MFNFSRDTIRALANGKPEPQPVIQELVLSIQEGIKNAAKEHKHSYRWDCREADSETVNFIWDLFHMEYNFSFVVEYGKNDKDIEGLNFYW